MRISLHVIQIPMLKLLFKATKPLCPSFTMMGTKAEREEVEM